MGKIVAEVKTQSPFGFKSGWTWGELFDIANRVGDIISIHTDPRWGGSLEKLREARKNTKKPILAKGIHATDDEIYAALDCGADSVLVVGRVPPDLALHNCCWFETLGLAQLQWYPPDAVVVWNQRDLDTGKRKTDPFLRARQLWEGTLCQASYIQRWSDLEQSAEYHIIGEYLPHFRSIPIEEMTWQAEYNPNCPQKCLMRFVGSRRAVLDKQPFSISHDRIGYGQNIQEASLNAFKAIRRDF